jgi:hypothetical protein
LRQEDDGEHKKDDTNTHNKTPDFHNCSMLTALLRAIPAAGHKYFVGNHAGCPARASGAAPHAAMEKQVIRTTLLAVSMLATTLQPVERVVSAHHGVCPTSSNRIYSDRAANLFSTPIKAAEYRGLAHTEAQLLRDGGRYPGNSTIFITFDKIRAVRFVGWPFALGVRTFGAQWIGAQSQPTSLYFTTIDSPKPPVSPGSRTQATAAPDVYYAGFEISGDPLHLASGECPTS